jgi:phosphodiesterase/alkaline phosphatase D-like protein
MGTFAEATRNSMLDAFARNVSYANAAVYVKLHTGDPGAAGANNAAANTTRQQATFGAGAASGAISNTAAVEWTNVSNTETYTHVSLWTASTNGTFLGSDDLSSSAAVTAGDTFRIPVGDLDLTIT